MKLNVFAGFRRLAALLALLWAGGVIFYSLANAPAAEIYYRVDNPQRAAYRVRSSHCGASDRREYDYDRETPHGTDYDLQVCFKAHPFEHRVLIPYKIENGRLLSGEPWSSEVTTYVSARTADIALTPADEKDIDAQRSPLGWAIARDILRWIAVGLFGIAILSIVIGWIVRGFLGIPAGQDYISK